MEINKSFYQRKNKHKHMTINIPKEAIKSRITSEVKQTVNFAKPMLIFFIIAGLMVSQNTGQATIGQPDTQLPHGLVANAQTLTSQEIVQTAEIESLKASDSEIPNKSTTFDIQALDTVQTLENWIKSQNPNLPAREIAECSYKYTTERKINHFLPLAITEKESNTWSHYKIQNMKGDWIDYRRGNDNFDDVKQIAVKQYRDHKIYFNGGGLMGRSKDWSDQNYSSKNLEYTLNFKGSIAGYTSYCEYLDNLTWLLDVGYLTTHSENLTTSDLNAFAKVYVGTSSYKQYALNISNILNKIQNN